MSTYVKLQKQIEALQAEAAKVLESEKAQMLAQVKEIIQAYALTPQEVFGRRGNWKVRVAAHPKSSAPAYGDANGNTWGGRGPRPQWLRDALKAGAQLEDFAMKGKAATPKAAAKTKPAAKRAAAKKAPRAARKASARKAASKKAAAAVSGEAKAE
jgi:DNA-binding protein H-NS